MINSFLNYTLASSLICVLLLLLHKPALRWLGARTLYNLWILPLLALVLAFSAPLIASAINQLLTLFNLSQPINSLALIEMTHTGQARLLSATSGLHFMIAAIWLTGALVISAVLVADAITLGRHRSAQIGQLRLQRSRNITTPGVFGLWSPTIQLPADFFACYAASERHLILQHELMHWHRGDTRANVVAWLILSTQWFNPIMWLAYSRFRADQELACDADVLARHATGKASQSVISAYADALLKTAINPSSHRGRGSIKLRPCSTHYGYQQGSFNMIKERLNSFKTHRPARRYPAVAASLIACSFTILWQLPAPTHAQEAPAAEQNQPLIPIVRIEPRYPAGAAEKGIEGHVDLSFVITPDGRTADITVLDSQPEGVFDEAVVAALERWRYAPQNNLQTTVRVQMTMGE